LQVFGLRHLDELPQAKHLRRPAGDHPLSETNPGASRADEISLPNKCIDEEEAQ
jgi:hypothetical protein